MKTIGFSRFCFGLLVLGLFAILAPSTAAQSPGGSTTWTGEYYNNTSLSDPSVLVGADSDIDFYWPEGTSPAPGYVDVNHYSVQWVRVYNLDSAGTWTVTAVADDGMRLWIDNVLIIDAWYDQSPTTYTRQIQVSAGSHTVRVEYYNNTLGGTAQVSFSQQGASFEWRGEYYANQTLSGAPALVRDDPRIAFDWGTGSPAPQIPDNHFSVRWTRTIYTEAGTYRVNVLTDDGARVWVGNRRVLNGWFDRSARIFSTILNLPAGNHSIRMEYYQDSVNAVARLTFEPLPPSIVTWRGWFFNNMTLSGSPVLLRDDPRLNFDWGAGSPAPSISVDNFSVAWDAALTLYQTDNYSVIATSDDGVRVWIDGQLIIDGWYDHPVATFHATRQMNAGVHAVHVEYYENKGGARVRLAIGPAVAPPQ